MFNILQDKGYFIGIGGEGKMFTLRRGNLLGEEWHIRNLSHTWEEAEKKAFEITGFLLPAPECLLNTLKSQETMETAVMPFGKYKGENINKVASFDLRYLDWIVRINEETFAANPNYKIDRTIKLISNLPALIEFREEQIRLKDEREAKWKSERESMINSSKHIGTIGERIEFTGTIMFIKQFDTSYGTGSMTKVHTDDGYELIYWNTFKVDASELGFDLNKLDGAKGDRITFFATVKEHNEYNGIKQTIVKRATKTKLLCPGEDTITYLQGYPSWRSKEIESNCFNS